MKLINFVNPELVVFDLDNTFYEYKIAHEFALRKLNSRLQLFSGLSSYESLKTYEKARLNVKKRLGSTASSHSRLLYLSEYFSVLNLDLKILEILRFETTYWNAFFSKMAIFPSALDFLDKLHSLGINCALVTDLTSEIQYKKIAKLGLQNKFKYVITSEEAGGDKETQLPWELLEERVHFSRISTTWYIGDSLHDLNRFLRRPKDIGFLKAEKSSWKLEDDFFQFSSFAELLALIN